MRIDGNVPLRIARPCADLAAAERFWVHGLGAAVLWRTVDAELEPGEHRLVMVGLPGAAWHLELVGDAAAAAAARPGEEDLLVLYLGGGSGGAAGAVPDELVERLVAAGGERVPSRNPYWDRWGVTVRDPDGYRLVLSHRTWGAG
jgi:catechol 2,3-dioxygenase-like lactoylglutathione lyase family enzyme